MTKLRLLGILFLGALVGQVMAAGWSPQLAQAAVNFINGFAGNFTLGSGLSVNIPFFNPDQGAYVNQNVLLQTTGTTNALRNGSMTSWAHYKWLTKDVPNSNPYVNGIASFTATIDNGSGSAGTTLTASSVTGTIQQDQRVTDTVNCPSQTNCVTNGTTAVGNNVLHFASTTGIAAGMYATDLTNPRAIAGNYTVASTTSNTVTLTGNTSACPSLNGGVGFNTNASQCTLVGPGVGSGDVIVFSTVARGTKIVRQLTGSAGGAGTYQVDTSQLVASETMRSAGGWSAEGIYAIPVGTAGTSSVSCTGVGTNGPGGNFAPLAIQCTAGGTLTDLIIRFPIDYVDASRINCALYAGSTSVCVSSNMLIQAITFQMNINFSTNFTSAPSFSSKNACPLTVGVCLNAWTNATTDIAPVTLTACTNVASPSQCNYAYTWVPTGIHGDMEVEFHTGAMTNGQYFTIDGFELKQTPGATCAGAAPPCIQLYPGPLEIPDAVSDMLRNARFAQLIGTGLETAINPGNNGAIETTMGFSDTTTDFLSTWPLPVTLRCNVWDTAAKTAPLCPPPNVYFENVADYTFTTAAATFAATALSVNKYGLNSIQIAATSSGMTAGQVGYVSLISPGMILLDSSIIGD